MDVVDSWVRRLRGRIDVETVAGQGTTFRLQIPLRSAVEHAMVIRAAGQLFALPMHTVSGTSDSRVPLSGLPGVTADAHAVPLTRILGDRHSQITRGCHVTLRGPAQGVHGKQTEHDGGVTIAVDAIVGVEEVVVRSLPPLLQRNELFAGVTLSGRAETVLLLDVGRLIELSRAIEHAPDALANSNSTDRATNDSRRSHDSDDHLRILIVDDSVTVRRSLSKKLRPLGYDTLEARNGREALDVLKTGGIAAVVTDIDMPGMNGVELLQEIKRQKHLQQLPVTVLTSRDAESMPQELRHLQPTAIIGKPVTDGTVAAIVESLSCADCPTL
jgi:CheY-like chemotaxis protein